MARWIFSFAEYNFSVEYKSGRLKVVAYALSRRPNFEPCAQSNTEDKPTVATLTVRVPSTTLVDDVGKTYAEDNELMRLMDHLVKPTRKSLKDLMALY